MMNKSYLEEDYESNYKEGWRPDPFGNQIIIPVGQLYEMCSPLERQEREQSQRLSKFEIEANSKPFRYDKNLTIKEFKRSSVGREFTSSIELRPWSVLKQTLHHLLLNICFKDEDWMLVCDFVFDRLKAVRQDLIIQRIEGLRYIEVLEGSIRFLVYSMYKLTCTLNDYSRIEEAKEIISNEGPVKGLNNYELNVVREMKLTMKCLRDCLNSLIIQYQENVQNSPNRSLFEAINFIVNLPFLHGHTFTTSDFLRNLDFKNEDPLIRIVFKMFRDHLNGNHLSAVKRLPKLFDYPLVVLAYAPAIAQVQIDLIHYLKKAYGTSGTNVASLGYLSSIICPEFLETDKDERLLFAQLMAIQFGIYDHETGCCDFKIKKSKPIIPRDFREKAEMDALKSLKASESGSDNETRIYALQMIFGKNWSFFQELIDIHGLKYILDPTQPEMKYHDLS